MFCQNFFSCLYIPIILLWSKMLLPIYGSHDTSLMVVPEKGKALFDKLRRINVDAMALPKVFQRILSKQEVMKVRLALQKILIKQEALPACVIESGCKPSTMDTNPQHMAYGLYDVLQYIYGKMGMSSRAKRRFVRYAEAYRKGILPVHLEVLDTAMYTAKNIRHPYLHDASFAKAFALLTANTYTHAIRPCLMYHDASTKVDRDHLTALAPMVSWLGRQTTRYVPMGVRYMILRYAFGRRFGAYACMRSVKDVVFQKKHARGECFYRGKAVAWRDIKMTKKILGLVWVSEHNLPYAFVERCVKRRGVFTKSLNVDSTHVDAMYECVRCCTVYDVLLHVRKMSYFDLLREGWTEEHGLVVEKSLQMHKPAVFAWLKQALLAVDISVILYLLGAFGASEATACMQYHCFNVR